MEGYLNCYFEKKVFERYFCVLDLQKGCLLCYTEFKLNENEGVLPEDLELEVPLTVPDGDGAEKRTVIRALGDKEREQYGKGRNGMFLLSNAVIGFNYTFEVAPHNLRNPRDIFPKSTMWVDAISFAICTCGLTEDDEKSLCRTLEMEYSRKFDRQNVKAAFMAKQKGVDPIRQTRLDEVNNAKKALMFIGERHEYYRLNHHNRFSAELIMRRSEKTGLLSLGLDFKCEENASILRIKSIDAQHILFLDNTLPPDYIQVNDVLESINGINVLHYSVHGIKSILSEHRIPEDCSVTLGFNRLTPKTASEILAMLEVEKAEDKARQANDIAKAATQAANIAQKNQQRVERQLMHVQTQDLGEQKEDEVEKEEHKSQVSSPIMSHHQQQHEEEDQQDRGPLIAKIEMKGLHGEDMILKVYEKNSTAQIRRFLTRHGIHGGPLIKMIDVIHDRIKIEEEKFRVEQEQSRQLEQRNKKKKEIDHYQDEYHNQLRFEQQLDHQKLQEESQAAVTAEEVKASSVGEAPPSIIPPASVDSAIRPLPAAPTAPVVARFTAAAGGSQQGSVASSKAGSKRPPPLFTAHELLDDPPTSSSLQHDVPREIHLATSTDRNNGRGISTSNEDGSQHSELTQSVMGSLPVTANASAAHHKVSLTALARDGIDTGGGMTAVYEEDAELNMDDDHEADQRSYESIQRMYFHNNNNNANSLLPQAVDDTFVLSTGSRGDGSAQQQGGRRQRARSHSPTSTSLHVRKVDAQVFRRLYEDAARVRDKREKLRGQFEEELQVALESSSFRNQLARISPHRQFANQDREIYRLQQGMTIGEQIYQDQMLWKERRDKTIAEKLSKQEKDRALLDYQTMQDKPQLVTSFAMQRRNNHETQSQLVERLHNTDLQSRQHKLLLSETYKSIFHQEQAYFIPKISAYSRKLAEKQRQRVSQQASLPPPAAVANEFMTPIMNSPYGYHEHEVLVMNEDEIPSLSKMIASSNNHILSCQPQQERNELDMDIIHLLRQDQDGPRSSSASGIASTGGGSKNGSQIKSQTQSQQQQQVAPNKALVATNNNSINAFNRSNSNGRPPRSQSPSPTKSSLFINPHAPFLHKPSNGSLYSEEESVYPYVDSTTAATAKAAQERGRSFSQSRSQMARSVSPSFMSRKFSQQSLTQSSQSPQHAISPLYDRLYSFKSERTLQRVETVKELIKLECPHTPSLTATSRYNKNSPAINERKKPTNPFNDVQDQRQDLYLKLNEDAKERARRLSIQRQAIADEIRAASNNGKRPLTDGEHEQLVKRLITKAERVQAKVDEKQQKIIQEQKLGSEQRFIQPRSSRIANKKLVYALIEIFNVLRVTVQYKKDMIAVQDAIIAAHGPPSPSSTTAMMMTAPAAKTVPQASPQDATVEEEEVMPVGRSFSGSPTLSDSEPSTQLPRSPIPVESSSSHRIEPARSVIEVNRESTNSATSSAVLEDGGLLDAKLADAKQLQPSALASAMTMALAACPQNRAITQTEFVDLVMDLMQRGKLPPIAYMLVHPTSDTDEKLLTQSTEAREMKELLDKPSLAAAKTTNALVKERYRDRIQGKQTVHDSLRDYRDFYSTRAKDRELQRVLYEDRECTFKPELIAASMQEAQRESVQRRQRMRDEQKKQKQRASSTPRMKSAPMAAAQQQVQQQQRRRQPSGYFPF